MLKSICQMEVDIACMLPSKDPVDINDLNGGLGNRKKILAAINLFYSGQVAVSLNGESTWKCVKKISAYDLKPGDCFAAAYNLINQGCELYQFLGFTSMDKKWGESGVAFQTLEHVFNHYKVSSIEELEDLSDILEYGHSIYMWVRDLTREEEYAYFYIFQGEWCRGSGAESITLAIVEQV